MPPLYALWYCNVSFIIVLFVEIPRKFITAVINLRGVSTNKTIKCFIAMQTYKELNVSFDRSFRFLY